MASLG